MKKKLQEPRKHQEHAVLNELWNFTKFYIFELKNDRFKENLEKFKELKKRKIPLQNSFREKKLKYLQAEHWNLPKYMKNYYCYQET